MQARDASDGVPEWYKDSATSTQKLTNSRGIELHLRLWTPSEAKVRAVMVLVHGFSWHSLYFGGLASQVAEHGARMPIGAEREKKRWKGLVSQR